MYRKTVIRGKQNVSKAFFGGSFDPPHLGHLGVARAALAAGRCSEVVWFPSFVPPHKRQAERAPFAHRLAMVRLLIDGEAGMSVSAFEDELRLDPSYTVEVLRALRDRTGETYRLLIGADSLLALHTWHRARELAEEFDPITYPRAGAEVTADRLRVHWDAPLAEKLAAGMIPGTFFEISSTEIKNSMEKNRFRHHIIEADGIPRPLQDYIVGHGLYRTPHDRGKGNS